MLREKRKEISKVDRLLCRFPNLQFIFHIPKNLFCHEIFVFYQLSLRLNAPSDEPILDPYEQKLFHLFSSHENGNGLIELIGLNNLVQTLQLKERGSVLINLLLKNGTRSGVSFQEFREGLLQVITSEDDGMSWYLTSLDLALRWWWWSITLTLVISVV